MDDGGDITGAHIANSETETHGTDGRMDSDVLEICI